MAIYAICLEIAFYICYLQWKNGWLMELAEMVKLTSLIRGKALINFNADWKSLLDFLHETVKNGIMKYGFD